MAENEILDLGHPKRWRRTRIALRDPACSMADLVTCAIEDLEGVCRQLVSALRKGNPLSILLGPALNSPAAAQAVIAVFQERRLATIVMEAKKRARSADPRSVAATAARLLIDSLVDQIRMRAGKGHTFRSCEARNQLATELGKAFSRYEEPLRVTIEASLRGGPIRPFKQRSRPSPRLTPQQLVGLSINVERSDKPHAR